MCILQHTHYEGCGHTHIFSIKNIHNHACPCEQVLHVERQGTCWECAAKEPVAPVMSRAVFEGILRDAGVTEEEMAAMRNRDRKEGEEGECEKGEGHGSDKEEGEGKEEDEVSDNSAQDGDNESRENSEDGHPPKEHGTQVIHYICGCSHTVYLNTNINYQQEIAEHSHAGVVCGRCLVHEELGRVAVVEIDTQELEKLREELALAKGLVEELKIEKLKLEGELRVNRGRLSKIEEADEEEDFPTGVSAPSTSLVGEPLKSQSQGKTPGSTNAKGKPPVKGGT